MAEKILYYLGAGASVEALPLARSTFENNNPKGKIRIPGLAEELRRISSNSIISDLESKMYSKWIEDTKRDLRHLASSADEFNDIDTYAKYLNLMHPGGERLIQLKKLISQYFAIKQTILSARDRRYLPWLVSILDNKSFPDSVKILNWNYDYQVQLAAENLGSLEAINYTPNGFDYSSSWLSYFPNLDPSFSEFSKLSLIHLNGIAGFGKNENGNKSSVFQRQDVNDNEKCLSFISKSNLSDLMHFAWEQSDYHSKLIEHVKAMIHDTSIMVVIGYSFPFFNREIDKMILKKLFESNKLRKIYYQDPVLTGEQLRAQFNLPKYCEIVHIQQVSNFHIPFEY